MNLFYINFFDPDSILLHGKDNCHCRAKLRVIWAPKLVTTQIADIYTAANHVADNLKFLKHQQRGRIEIGTAPHCIRGAPTHQKLLPEQAHHCEQHSFRCEYASFRFLWSTASIFMEHEISEISEVSDPKRHPKTYVKYYISE